MVPELVTRNLFRYGSRRKAHGMNSELRSNHQSDPPPDLVTTWSVVPHLRVLDLDRLIFLPRRTMKFLLSLAVAISVVAGCAPSSKQATSAVNDSSGATPSGTAVADNSNAGKTLQIAVIPKGTSHEFWKSVHAGAQNAAQELGGVEIVWKGPAQENDTQGQIDVVQNMITRRVSAIVLAPNNSEALVDVVQEAQAEGIPV